jgi:hypothetical protein
MPTHRTSPGLSGGLLILTLGAAAWVSDPPVTTYPSLDPSYRPNILGLVALRSSTEGASVGYQVQGRGETSGPHWQVYTEPVTQPAGSRLRSVAHRLGYAAGDIVTVGGP